MTDKREDDVLAAELALGLLEGQERAVALRRLLEEPAFATDVEEWRLRFAQLFDLWPEVEPPEGLIERIDMALGGPAPGRGRRLPWPLLAIVSSAIAAVLLVVVALRPTPVPERVPVPVPGPRASPVVVRVPVPVPTPVPVPAPTSEPSDAATPSAPAAGPLLLAALGQGEQAVAAAYDPATGRLRLPVAPRVRAGRVPQLWVIGADQVPYPLGLLGATNNNLILAAANRPRLVTGATLAVSAEPPGGSPTGKPTGPVVATGALRRA